MGGRGGADPCKARVPPPGCLYKQKIAEAWEKLQYVSPWNASCHLGNGTFLNQPPRSSLCCSQTTSHLKNLEKLIQRLRIDCKKLWTFLIFKIFCLQERKWNASWLFEQKHRCHLLWPHTTSSRTTGPAHLIAQKLSLKLWTARWPKVSKHCAKFFKLLFFWKWHYLAKNLTTIQT